jgi:gluconate 2-dehydrogenase gamma chain
MAAAVAATSKVVCAADGPPVAAPFTGYQFFGADEAAFVEALVNVMCPADRYTPSGVDCGLANYIDRQLAGAFGQGEGRYMRGPWKQGKPQLGYQLPLTPAQFFKVGLTAAGEACTRKYGKAFDQLSPADADACLQDMQSGKYAHPLVSLASWFNDLVYPLFVQACFADPVYGGNNNKVFWKLVGYPGLPATHALDMVQYRGKPYPGAKDPKSIVDFS